MDHYTHKFTEKVTNFNADKLSFIGLSRITCTDELGELLRLGNLIGRVLG